MSFPARLREWYRIRQTVAGGFSGSGTFSAQIRVPGGRWGNGFGGW